MGGLTMREFDWAVMILKLEQEGLSQAEISRRTGISAGTLSPIKTELKEAPKSWNDAMNLLDLYIKIMGSNVPRIGDYYEDEISITE
jgi:transcriptional regulator with XRE-family HTH domain